jgi:hypothetical protein
MKLASKALVGIGLALAVMAIGCGGRVTEPGGGGSSGAGGASGSTGDGGSSGAGGTSGTTGTGGSSGVGGTSGATGAGGSSGVVTDDGGGPCSSKHSASCVCVCADSAGDSGCVNPVCSFSEAYCFGPRAGCPAEQVCSVYGDICTPICGDDGACPEGMMAVHLLP